MSKTTLAATTKKMAEDAKAKEAKENLAAASEKVKEGEVKVRLIRPFQVKSGMVLPAGIHTLKRSEIPKSAIILGAVTADSDDE